MRISWKYNNNNKIESAVRCKEKRIQHQIVCFYVYKIFIEISRNLAIFVDKMVKCQWKPIIVFKCVIQITISQFMLTSFFYIY